ncbi:MAG: STAS/SEC14 domain-containing protein [Algoriphagus sp.]|jgi:hypothetical protein|uniref:STAS/SEC14 domain-containing protein n=1 Tax=Algoriphagus sp. TaxID=1872435 RepID=UPI00261ABC67|nr:STAS/SEC14 domain-containing protein [Algoriphagus sp.]MDG1276688.1 STAS/SEC14 domain-containing protein [Algoriphagus sp.]
MQVDFDAKESLLVYTIDGVIDKSFMDELRAFQSRLEPDQKLRVLVIVPQFGGYRSFAAAKSAFLFDSKILPHLTNYVMVTYLRWLQYLIKMIGLFFPKIEFTTFDLDQRELALKWLKK